MTEKATQTAAIAAVLTYIKTEEEALAMQAADSASQVADQPAATADLNFSSWRLSGRQTQMQLRTLMQLRALRR